MQVKAFTLMELVVVILLLGLLSLLVLNNFNFKRTLSSELSIENFPTYIKKLGLEDSMVFYIYGDKCEKNILLSHGKSYKKNISLSFKKSYKVLKMNTSGKLEQVIFSNTILSKKIRHVCFKLNFQKRGFSDKIILDKDGKYLLFLPIYQEVKEFSTLEDAKNIYFNDNMLPKSIDDYYSR